jgi:hypothetical protein
MFNPKNQTSITMKPTTTPGAAATSNSAACSDVLNSLALLSPQRFNTPLLMRKHRGFPQEDSAVDFSFSDDGYPLTHSDCNLQCEHAVKHLIPTVDIPVGTDPQVLIRRAIYLVAPGTLRNFLRSVMAERDVNRVLTTLQHDDKKFHRLPIDRLRSAAQTASHKSLQGPCARDTVYAAVLIAGIESLLGETVESPYTSGDVIRSVVRDAMRELVAVDLHQANGLRNCLGWGDEDDLCNARTKSLQYQVNAAVRGLRNNPALSHQAGQA